ncbi:type II toxin-antitoxin system HipA family toxin [Nitratidesulfovibrio vulgaris]|uniref:HipA domain protein n=1 Tax=Nitratidesulfovibrio vulgaris (strain DP4) TaxID=391774 RepID=A0A0H3AC95_NITV4|nr:type II toxin-antitoxin system HipA family toxin [Nitratidesulfovibrio vulgaris]ABM29969.1 HipA domain protein [Nitratidesulfovibrio vulgaris DP4]
MTSDREAVVFVWLSGQGYVPAALLSESSGGASYTLGYGRRYAARPDALPLDPVSLPLYMPRPATSRRGVLFPVLRDAAPDKWGRKVLGLMAGRHAGTLSEMDFLISAHSPDRIGALAFGDTPAGGPRSLAAWAKDDAISLPEDDPARPDGSARLERIARVVAEVDALDDDEDLDDLRKTLPEEAFLQALASSLSVGGGRPKALVRMPEGHCIAKFGKRGDPWDEPRIEHATMTLAARCGIHVSPTRLMETDHGSVLLVRRFDRTPDGTPRHFISGFTLNAAIDEDGDWGSYHDLAQRARQHGDSHAGPELFRRMVFNALCANIDDHPRNHAWFVEREGLSMTPAYDIVPTQARFKTYDLALRCGTEGRRASLANVLTRPEPFGLRRDEAEAIARDIAGVMSTWRDHFAACGVVTKDLDELAYRFRGVPEGV